MKKLKLALLTVLLLSIMTLPPLANATNGPFFNGFYAVQSYTAKEHIKDLNTITYGWSRVAYDKDNNVVFTCEKTPLSTKDQQTEYSLPSRYQEQVLDYTKRVNPQAKEYLQVIATDRTLLLDLLQLNNKQLISQVIEPMVDMVNDLKLDGVVIDFEGLTAEPAEHQKIAQKFNSLLASVNKELGNKELIVAVQPRTIGGVELGYAYDYRFIGKTADTVILMAHDYEHHTNGIIDIAASAPYYLVNEAVVDTVKLIPAEKLVLQVSLSVEQWVKTANGFQLNKPTMAMLNAALSGQNGQVLNANAGKGFISYNAKYNNKLYNLGYTYLQRKQNGCIIDSYFYYENARSILAKINLAAQYNLKGLSIWRLGLEDADTWTKVNNYMKDQKIWSTGNKSPQ